MERMAVAEGKSVRIFPFKWLLKIKYSMRGWRFKGKGNAGRIKVLEEERKEETVSLTSVAVEPSHLPYPTCDVFKFRGEEKLSP